MLARNPRLTAAGLALFTNQAPGFSVSVTHIALGGTNYDPTGGETALKSEFARFPISTGTTISASQIQIGTLVTNTDPQARSTSNKYIGEIGFYVGATLLAVLSQSDRALFYKSPDLDVPISYVLDFSTLPPGSLVVAPMGVPENLQLAAATAQASGQAAVSAATAIRASYYGSYDYAPGTRPDGTASQKGDRYFDKVAGAEKTWNGNAWYIPNLDTAALAAPSGASMIGNGAATLRVTTDKAAYRTAMRSGEKPMIIAHRGFDLTYPQNTMLAFSSCVRAGADAIELDVSFSSDGVAYIFHDDTVDALTTGTGAFISLSSATIDALRFKALAGTIYADEPIARFADVLKWARKVGVPVFAELKQVSQGSQLAQYVQMIIDADMVELTSAQTGYMPNAVEFRNLCAGLNVGYIGAGTDYAAVIDQLAALGNATATWSHDSVFAAPDMVAYCAARGVDLAVYTVPDTYYMNRVARLGVNKFVCSRNIRGVR